ncbi:VOC family protein [Cellulosimicrobium sp. Marseille-Q4280]|uniref:VOC family protein n=1 Tax=Cellulosimicrobium sp. Marseille-Q4280 TaxID=2937992 RepID=UPI002041D06E|nr:VOC family protein [Cellulosimicrobium sp. Marseille-Q4280]
MSTETSRQNSTDTSTAPAAPAPSVWPTLRARDAHALIEFLTTVLGFAATAVHADGDVVQHAELTWPEGGGVMLGSDRPGTPWTQQPGTGGAYVVTDRVDEVHDRAVAAGARIIQPLGSPDYGGRTFACADPEGNLWSFGSYRGESTRP